MNVTTVLPVRKGCNERASMRPLKSILSQGSDDPHGHIIQRR
jgi:hypothetical protein